MTSFARLLVDVLCLACGWLLCLWWHGLLVPSDVVSAAIQQTGEQFIAADRRIAERDTALAATRERVREIIREVPVHVATECPPGVGPVSDPVLAGLRNALEAAERATAKPAGSVRAGSAGPM